MIVGLCRSCKHYENEHVCENCRGANVLYEPCMGNMWISVKDRLPEGNGYYLVWCGYSCEIAFYMDWCNEWDVKNRNQITHWMPLPASPKDGE